MGSSIQKRRVFEFLDYREFLLDYFNTAKQINPRYSLRAFSDRLGFKSKDFISRIMKGEKSLTSGSITQICSGLGLNLAETQYFESLVYLCQAQTREEREKYSARVESQIKSIRFSQSQLQIHFHQYEVYSCWHHSAVRSLIGMHGFDGDYKRLGAWMRPKISAKEARHSVDLLIRNGLLFQQEDGSWLLTRSAISSGDRVSKMAFRTFHLECLRLAADSIDSVPAGERNISGLTLGISRTKYEQIVQRLNSFRKEIAMMAEEDPGADRVYQLNLQLFPMSFADADLPSPSKAKE